MAYMLNNIDLTIYGIIPGRGKETNICIEGCFDMPSRSGKTHHEWGDEHGVEAYVQSYDMQFNGRDITYYGLIIGDKSHILSHLSGFYTAVKAYTTLVPFSTPYGIFNVLVKQVNHQLYDGIATVEIQMREPVVTLTGGTLPATGTSLYTVDGRPFISFGLYFTITRELYNLPELKEQFFTKYGAEGYQITKRKNNKLDFKGVVIAETVEGFLSNIKALYAQFAAAGIRQIVLNGAPAIPCFAVEGFKIDRMYVTGAFVVSDIQLNLMIATVIES